jgi:ribosomal protein S18 acetylase RimI-like enzyme
MITVELEDDPDGQTLEGLINGVRTHNDRVLPGMSKHVLTVAARDETGALLGGVVGRMVEDSMYIEVVWTSEAVRGTGIGRQMMVLLEDQARVRGAAEIWLYTMSFQAKPFYEKLGYSQFAELPWRGGKMARHFMRKDIV